MNDNTLQKDIPMPRRFFLAIVTAASAALLLGCNRADVITVGLNVELTGSIPTVGKSCVNAAAMAAREVNARGGIALGDKTVPVKLRIEDNEDKAEGAAAVAQKFVSAGCVAMIGPNASRNAVPAAVVAESNKLLMISPWSTNPKLTEGKRYIYRACFTDDFQGVVVAAFVLKKLAFTKAAVLFDMASEYNKGIASVFKTEFTRSGGTLTAFESYATGDKDFSAQLSKIKQSGAEVLFLPNYYNEVPLQIRQARQQGFTGAIVGSDSWGSEEILKLGGDLMNGCYFTTHYAPDIATEKAKKFIGDYTALYGAKPDDVAALTYDACAMLFESIQKAASRDPEKVRAQLSVLSEFEGVTGAMRFTPGSGSPFKSAVVIQIKNNAFTYYDSINPL
ncbi:MAG: ABC transporter substrate-binding protein [Chitinivibrionales bacterium]|nr:ABC transporter substrate-binding protein [Chitinivibrionales bacterium]